MWVFHNISTEFVLKYLSLSLSRSCTHTNTTHINTHMHTHTPTRQSGGSPGHRVWHISLLSCGDNQRCPKTVGEAKVGVTISQRGFRGYRRVVGEELYGGSSQGLVSAGIAQVNLQSHLCGQTERLLSCVYSDCWCWCEEKTIMTGSDIRT